MNVDPVEALLAERLEQALSNITNSLQATQQQMPYAQRQKQRLRTKAVTYNANTQYAHGPSGVWNTPGVDRDVWGISPRPLGISSLLPMMPTQYVNEFFEYFLPVTAGSGSEPADDCSKGPNPGDVSVGFMYLPFGKTIRTTKAIDVNRMGYLMNNAEPIDLNLVNPQEDTSPWIPDPAKNSNMINSELGMKYFTLGLEMERVNETDSFTGNPASNSPSTLGKLYYKGLDQQINTGRTDTMTGASIQALDSLLVNWNGAAYNASVSLAGQTADFLTALSSMMNYFIARARITNSLPATWSFLLRYDLFYLLTAMWPCSYLTNGCTTTNLNGATQYVTGGEQVAMRDEMRSQDNPGLWVNGVRYPVVITDQNSLTTGGFGQKSDFYILNTAARGRSTAYYQYFSMDNPMLNEMANVAAGRYWTTNSGLYLWTYDTSQYCLDVSAKTQPRLILRRPDLCGRIQNVAYKAYIPTNISTPGALYAIPAGTTVGITSGLYTS